MTREEAIKLLVNATYSDEWQGNEQLTKANLMAIEALKAEPIVRCKDCFYLDEDEFENGDVVLFCNFMRAELNDMEMDGESYCSNGERREP